MGAMSRKLAIFKDGNYVHIGLFFHIIANFVGGDLAEGFSLGAIGAMLMKMPIFKMGKWLCKGYCT